jgi:hypothetical protein
MSFFSAWIDFIFPPFCLACRERSKTKFFCHDCWNLCKLPDPIDRCRHCFQELDKRENLCRECRWHRRLPATSAYVFDAESPARILGLEAVEAMAGFALIQWIQLEWETPYAIIPMPDSDSVAIAKEFAFYLNCSFIPALKSNCDYRQELLEEEKILLLFAADPDLEKIKQAVFNLSETFPKKIYILTLFERGERVSPSIRIQHRQKVQQKA